MNRLMIDIEALGLQEDTVVLSIGIFNMDSDVRAIIIPSLEEQERTGRTINVSTVQWWMEQSEEAKRVFSQNPFNGGRLSCAAAAETLMDFIDMADEIWANGVDYDFKILSHFVRQYAPERKWPYWQQMDYRTIKSMFKGRFDHTTVERGVAHDALADAVYQGECLKRILATLGR